MKTPSLRHGRAPLSGGLVLLACFAMANAAHAAEDVAFPGRVVHWETRAPIAGAEVVAVVEWPGASAEQATRADADGRFTFKFPREGDPRRMLTVRARQAGHIARVSTPTPLDRLLEEKRRGEPSFFETITLEPGEEYTGTVVRPHGSPAAGVPFWFENWQASHRAPSFRDDDKGTTDAQGRFRLWMPKTQALAIYITPTDLAPYQHFWGADRPAEHPDVWAPTDLGRIVLDAGVTLSGRVLDLRGQPIGGFRIEAAGRGTRDHRATKTDASGAFRFPPMRPGSYTVRAEGQGHGPYFDPTERTVPEPSRPILPTKVVLRRGEGPVSIDLREAPSVVVSTRFIDSAGRPAKGGPVVLSGLVPGEKGQADPFGGVGPEGRHLASSINDEVVEDPSTRLDWGLQVEPDAEGRAVFRAPKGLLDADLSVFTVGIGDESKSLKTRLKPGGPRKFWGGGQLGTLDADVSGIEFIVYDAPTVLVTVASEDGEPIREEVQVDSHFAVNGFGYGGGRFVRQRDGQFRSERLMPDQPIEVAASAKGYLTARSDRISLPEGGSGEVTLTLGRTPAAAKVGDLAPPFLLKTIEGKPLSPADFAGKPLLMAFWESHHDHADDLPRLNALHKEHGGDGKLAVIGLNYDFDPADLARYVKDQRLGWPQARIGPSYDRLRADYGLARFPCAVLIGPDGTIIAKDLKGPAIDAAVETLLAK